MQDSMMIAEVGGIVKVSGSRMATPLAPPRPGSTPMMTPSTTPTNISIRLNGVSATPNPWTSELISSNDPPYIRKRMGASRALVQLEPPLERSLRQWQREPHLEQQEERGADADGDQHGLRPGILAQPPHEERDEDRRGHVQAERLDQRDVDDRRHQHPKHLPEGAARDEGLGRFRLVPHRAVDHDRGRETDQHPDVEGKVARLRPVL